MIWKPGLRFAGAFLVLAIGFGTLIAMAPGSRDNATVIQRADSCTLAGSTRVPDPAAAWQLLMITWTMERLGDSAKALVIRAFTRAPDSPEPEFEAPHYFSSAADVAEDAALLDRQNSALLIETARLAVRAGIDWEGPTDTARMRRGLGYLACAADLARAAGDPTTLRRVDSLKQVINAQGVR